MKKIKLILTFALVLSLCFSVFPLASESPSGVTGDAFSGAYSEQLTDTAKEIFDGLYKAREEMKTGTREIVIEITPVSDSKYVSSCIGAAVGAVYFGCPDFFWVDYAKAAIFQRQSGGVTKAVVIKPSDESGSYLYERYSGADDVNADIAAIETAADRIVSEAKLESSPGEQLLYIHDWLADNNTYNTAFAENSGSSYGLAWGVLSALTSDNSAENGPVCEGYARAFQLLATRLGYPCVLVIGSAVDDGEIIETAAHIWNYVYVGGGWYAVDVTWDDRSNAEGGEVYHNNFLAGSDTRVLSAAKNNTFSDIHIPDAEKYMGSAFNYPPLCSSSYSEGGIKSVGISVSLPEKINYADSFTLGVTISPKLASLVPLSVYYDTMSAENLLGTVDFTVESGLLTVKIPLDAGVHTIYAVYPGALAFKPAVISATVAVEPITLGSPSPGSLEVNGKYDKNGELTVTVSGSPAFEGAPQAEEFTYTYTAEQISDPDSDSPKEKFNIVLTDIVSLSGNYVYPGEYSLTLSGEITEYNPDDDTTAVEAGFGYTLRAAVVFAVFAASVAVLNVVYAVIKLKKSREQ